MSGDTYSITDSEAKNIKGKSGLVFVPTLKGLINLSSVESVMPDEIAIQNSDNRVLHDGTKAIRKFGTWYLEGTDVKINQHHYPELAKDINVEQVKKLN